MSVPKISLKKFLACGALFLLLILGLAFAGVSYVYQTKYYPGTKVGKVDISGKSREEAKELIVKQTKSYLDHKVIIVVPDVSKSLAGSPNQYEELELPTNFQTLGLSFAIDSALENAWQAGHNYKVKSWLPLSVKTLFFGQKRELAYSINLEAVRSFIDTDVVPKIGAPIPAKIVVQGDKVLVEAAKPGFEVDKAELAKQLAESTEDASEKQASYIKAPVKIAESPIQRAAVQPIADQLDAIGNIKIALNTGSSTVVPKKEQILSWFAPVQDEKNQLALTIQQESITKYLVTQKNLNQQKALAAVVDNLTPLLTASTPNRSLAIVLPTTVKPIPPDIFTPGKFEGKYVEVNLSTQKLYLITGSSLEKSYRVSTGKWSTPTPIGTFTIQGKAKRAYSRRFGLYMPYWQNFLNNEYGLHELPEWPNGYKEGQGHLGTPVSHGCIRLGVGDAEQVYNWTENGTPIYIHT